MCYVFLKYVLFFLSFSKLKLECCFSSENFLSAFSAACLFLYIPSFKHFKVLTCIISIYLSLSILHYKLLKNYIAYQPKFVLISWVSSHHPWYNKHHCNMLYFSYNFCELKCAVLNPCCKQHLRLKWRKIFSVWRYSKEENSYNW